MICALWGIEITVSRERDSQAPNQSVGYSAGEESVCAELAMCHSTWKGQVRLSRGGGSPDGVYRSCKCSLDRFGEESVRGSTVLRNPDSLEERNL